MHAKIVKRPLERPRRRRKTNIEITLEEIGCAGLSLLGSGACGCKYGNEPKRSTKGNDFFLTG
jgi:hypothetical protein